MRKILILITILAALLISCGKKKLTKEQQHKMVYGAVLLTRNDFPYDRLPDKKDCDKCSVEVLSRDWDITDKKSTTETLDILLNEGTRAEVDLILPELKSPNALSGEYAEVAAAYNSIRDALVNDYGYTKEEIDNIKTISTWDYDRLINVARFAYDAGYITEEEMWSYIDKTVVKARNDYDSWKSYFAGVMLGRGITFSNDFSENKIVADKLLKDKNSPYNKFSFK